uniref:Uncharacterized protein n=1 Tax=Arundo donax TaxID=35708 RepID=A0A0A9DMK5_ARUDO
MDLDRVARPNVAFLRQCGVNPSEVAGTNLYSTRLFTVKPELLREAAERVEELGVERGARIFRRALVLVAFTSKEVVDIRVHLLRKLGFSQDDVLGIARKAPLVLGLSEQKVQRNVDFLMKDVGLEVPYIARRPALFMYSVERRLSPPHWLLKVLREKELLKGEPDYYVTASMSKKAFVQKFVLPYKDHVPGLVDGYASKYAGKTMDRVAWPDE